SVNRCGVKGRGETVSVTNQTIMSLQYTKMILDKLTEMKKMDPAEAENIKQLYDKKITSFTNALNKYAFNKKGYYNSVFNDDGYWLFSDNDPDGEKRVYGPANWFSLMSGAAIPDKVDTVLKQLDFLKFETGYRMYWPPMGRKPIPNVGRAASGDGLIGLWENGTVYNQGSHGFLARGLAAAGKGDLLYEVFKYLTPYDQSKHPVAKTMSPPYAMVNCWQEVPGFLHRGGIPFLTGSISMALRAIYDWMLGIKPMLDGLSLDPVLPEEFDKVKTEFKYLGKTVMLKINNPHNAQCGIKSGTLNGKNISRRVKCPFSQRDMLYIEDVKLRRGSNHIELEM
ncbi:MAG TPA: hypothetical protein VKS21_11755, partial [Spirochaetota bacterium]|nr:hypothetical protein [Spirochaetota bacterium]